MSHEVLIVDDDQMVLYLHKMLVQQSGFYPDPRTFDQAKEAVDYILQGTDQKKMYVVLLDINMPVMNGWEFLEKINGSGIRDQVLVVMITSSIDKADREKAAQYPLVIDYLEKPVNITVLKRLRERLLLDRFFRNGPGDQ